MKTVLPAVWILFQYVVAVDGFSSFSTFLGHRRSSSLSMGMRRMSRRWNGQSQLVMYEEPLPSKPDAWSVLATTEKWITETLQASVGPSGVNAYARKQGVSYVCETSSDAPFIVAGIFRRIKGLREAGEKHGREQEPLDKLSGPPRTMRQTQVVVVPGNKAFMESFHAFENVMEQIKQARRNARDLVTDLSLEELEEEDEDDDERLWSVAINCAHMHPQYGKLTPEEQLEQMKKEEEEGEVDVNYSQYVERRNQARQSPFPTIVLEVRAVPPPDFSRAPPSLAAMPPSSKEEETKVTLQDIQRLEALFGKSAHVAPESPSDAAASAGAGGRTKDSFYEAIGNSIEEVSAITPIQLVQTWVAKNDPAIQNPPNGAVASFTETDTQHVDEAYEFTFTNLAMMKEMVSQQPVSIFRQYLVMPSFLSYAATSFEKFAMQVDQIVQALPDCTGHVRVQTFHPEHVDPSNRSPSPTLVLEWK